MIFNSFAFVPKSFIGIDIGTAAIKVAEISGWGEKRTLKNYGQIDSARLYEGPFRTYQQDTLHLSSRQISKALKAIFQETGIETKKAAFSIPDFSTFFTTFDLPSMTEKELPEAVRYEARRHVPIPISEVTYDWQIVHKPKKGDEEGGYKILMVAVPNNVVYQYQEIAKFSKLDMVLLEAEVFGIIRSSLTVEDKRGIMVIDVGAQSTTISVVANGILHSSYSFDVAGNDFTERISSSLGIKYPEAEQLKKTKGLDIKSGNSEILLPIADSIFREMEKIIQAFKVSEHKSIEQVILAGNTSLLPGFREYLQQRFLQFSGITPPSHPEDAVQIARPFQHLAYSPVLEETLKEMGPSYAVAVGLALRGFE